MKYTKTFKDIKTGDTYYVSECCINVENDELKHLVLVGINGGNVVEVSIDYGDAVVKQVGYISGHFMEIGVDEFDSRFVEVRGQ